MPIPARFLCTLAVAAVLATAAFSNVLQNPGFEALNTGWTDYGNSNAITGQAFAGTYSLRTGTAAGGRVQNTNSPAIGAVYQLSAQGKFSSASGSETGWLIVRCYNSSNVQIATEWTTFANSTTYNRAACAITPPTGTAYFQTLIWKDAGTRFLDVDNVALTRVPTASFTATPTSGAAPLAVNFNAGASFDPDGSIASYAWDFGDGTTGTGVTPSRTYAAPGIYNVILTVTDNSGATATTNLTVTATGPAYDLIPDGGFELDDPYFEWTDWGNATRVSNNARTGSYSLRVGTAAGGRAVRLLPITVGNTYTFSAWGKFTTAGTDSAYVTVRFLDANEAEISKVERVYTNETAYTQYSVNFTVPAGTNEVRCQVWKVAGPRNFYTDDWSLIDTTTEPVTASVTVSGTPTILKASGVGINHEMAMTSDAMSSADGQWMTQTFNGAGIKFMRWGYGAWNWHWQLETPLTTAYYSGYNTEDDAGTFGLDEFLDYCIANNVTPLIILPFEAHAENGSSPFSFTDILNISQSLVQHVASRGITNAWFDVGNEPWVNSGANAYGAFTASYYASKLPAFYSMIKAVNTNYKVVASIHDPAWDSVVYTADSYFDAVNEHPYSASPNLWAGYYAQNGDNFWTRGTANPAYPNKQVIVGETNVLWPFWFNPDYSPNPVGPPNHGAGFKLVNLLLDTIQANIASQVLTWPSHWITLPDLPAADAAVGFFSYSDWDSSSTTKRNQPSVLAHMLVNRHSLTHKVAAASNDPKVRAFGFASDTSRTRLSVFLLNKRAGSRAVTLSLPQSYGFARGFVMRANSVTDANPVYEALFAPGTAVGGTSFTVTIPRESVGVIEFYPDTSTSIPGTFSQTVPSAAGTGVSKACNFVWAAASDATNYRLTVSTNSSFTAPVIDADVGNATNFQSTVKLAPSTIYYWRVIASNKNGTRTATNSGITFTTAAGN